MCSAPPPPPPPATNSLLDWAPRAGGGSGAVCSRSLRRRLGWAGEARGRGGRDQEKGAGPTPGSWGTKRTLENRETPKMI